MQYSGASYYYTQDNVNSSLLLTTQTQTVAAAYTYDPYGKTTSSGTMATTNPWRYASGCTDDPTGLTKFGARYYNPTIGRFNQTDPSGQEPNRYNYASDNPIGRVDQSGLCDTPYGEDNTASSTCYVYGGGDGGSDTNENGQGISEAIDGGAGCVAGLTAVDESGAKMWAFAVGGPLGELALQAAACAGGFLAGSSGGNAG